MGKRKWFLQEALTLEFAEGSEPRMLQCVSNRGFLLGCEFIIFHKVGPLTEDCHRSTHSFSKHLVLIYTFTEPGLALGTD